jgi:3-methyladenine DNA glycosylase AlkD
MRRKAIEPRGRTAKKTSTRGRQKTAASAKASLASVIAWLERQGSEKVRDGMARYAIPSDKAFGIPVGALRKYAKELGTSHELAAALWKSGHYEARMLASFVDDPGEVTPEQMDRWCEDFDNWAICDTACFALFDRTPHAWRKVAKWAKSRDEFVKRAAFALLASLIVHDKRAADEPFVEGLALVERAARDERNFVKKAVNWALRSVGKRNAALNLAAVQVARRLAQSPESAPRWVGKDALRDLASPAVQRRLANVAASKRRDAASR